MRLPHGSPAALLLSLLAGSGCGVFQQETTPEITDSYSMSHRPNAEEMTVNDRDSIGLDGASADGVAQFRVTEFTTSDGRRGIDIDSVSNE